jgi:3-phosphoshikimate 1-carboxyvinyltransferase
MLRALGATVDTEAERLVVHSRAALRPGVVESHGDHRIAMAGAIAALAVRAGGGGGGRDGAQPVRVNGWDAVATSYPGFLDDLAAVAVPSR